MLGVAFQPGIQPALLNGPVWAARVPICGDASHSMLSARVPGKDGPGLVIIEIGYSVSQLAAFVIAARGFGSAYGLCHMLPWPTDCAAEALAAPSIDSSTSHLT